MQPDQADAFRGALQTAGVQRYDWYPMIRGRLVAINGRAAGAGQYSDERASRLVEREFNLSHTPQQPPHNQIVAGRWTPEEKDGLVKLSDGHKIFVLDAARVAWIEIG